jgi:hypothetical protein
MLALVNMTLVLDAQTFHEIVLLAATFGFRSQHPGSAYVKSRKHSKRQVRSNHTLPFATHPRSVFGGVQQFLGPAICLKDSRSTITFGCRLIGRVLLSTLRDELSGIVRGH